MINVYFFNLQAERLTTLFSFIVLNVDEVLERELGFVRIFNELNMGQETFFLFELQNTSASILLFFSLCSEVRKISFIPQRSSSSG